MDKQNELKKLIEEQEATAIVAIPKENNELSIIASNLNPEIIGAALLECIKHDPYIFVILGMVQETVLNSLDQYPEIKERLKPENKSSIIIKPD